MEIKLNSPKYAETQSLQYQMYKKQADRKKRKNFTPELFERYFRRNEGTTDYATIPEVTLAGDFVIEFDVLISGSPSTSNKIMDGGGGASRFDVNVIFGAIDARNYFTVFVNEVQTNTITYNEFNSVRLVRTSANTDSDQKEIDILMQRVGASGSIMEGILANLKIWDNGTLIRDYPLDDNSDILRNRATVLGENINESDDPLASVPIGGAAITTYDLAPAVIGNTYIVRCTVSDFVGSGTLGIFGANGLPVTNISGNGVLEVVFTATTSFTVELFSRDTNQCTFSNISIRQADGYGTVINGNASDWGLFQQQVTREWLGQELVVNGGFDTDSDWTKAVGVTIDGGQCVFTSVGSTLGIRQEPVPIVNGATARVGVDILSVAEGQFRYSIADSTPILIPNNIGRYAADSIVGSGVVGRFNFVATGVTSGSIDNVSIKEVLNVA